MAIATSYLDAFECVLRKIGLDDAEFTSSSGTGRVHLYQGSSFTGSYSNKLVNGGAKANGSVTEDTLWGTTTQLMKYNAIFFPCKGDQDSRSSTEVQRLVSYANAGGRVFATHFSYIWLNSYSPFATTANWNVEQSPAPSDQVAYINNSTDSPKSLQLANWLYSIGASTTSGQISLQGLRADLDGVIAPSETWISLSSGVPVLYAFNTPVGTVSSQQCGRVMFNSFHVENVTSATGLTFPAECSGGTMTAQEKLLEHLIFDLTSCLY